VITVIIGQRGVGKTQFLKRLHRYMSGNQVACLDLDHEIEKKSKKTIQALFESEGEAGFRDWEKRVFQELIASHSEAYIAVGAGFPVGLIPETAKTLWVQRATDQNGRIFLDRPRLEKDLSPIEEYKKRARLRDLHFHNIYDQIYIMPEGLSELDSLEDALLVKRKRMISGAVAVTPELFLRKNRWHSFIENYSGHGVEFFELRDDLLNHAQIQTCLGSLFTERFIFSFRTGNVDSYPQGGQVHYFDWPIELGTIPQPIRFLKQRLIISLHDLLPGESLEDAIRRLNEESSKCVHLKLAPLVKNFEDLLLGYLWQQADPQNRSFLPRSAQGRWAWFRLWMKGRQLINFWREGQGTSADQPTLYEWQSVHLIKTRFAAVLGSPIIQSWTPMEQHLFFEERNEPVFRIQIEKSEWSQALKILVILGMRHAAVTSPLKEEAFYSADEKSEEAESLRSVNTLYYNQEDKKWCGHNTDLFGFRALIEDVKTQKNIAVWGGGGTLNMIKRELPNAVSFSSTRGEVREEDRPRWSKDFQPDILIWASPRKEDMKWPSADWKPKLVVDLNYTEDSAGREYALRVQAEYRSGVKMFQVQAQHQRDFWESQK
jgi:shikimate 5-dehydrogenase/shikimate kinase